MARPKVCDQNVIFFHEIMAHHRRTNTSQRLVLILIRYFIFISSSFHFLLWFAPVSWVAYYFFVCLLFFTTHTHVAYNNNERTKRSDEHEIAMRWTEDILAYGSKIINNKEDDSNEWTLEKVLYLRLRPPIFSSSFYLLNVNVFFTVYFYFARIWFSRSGDELYVYLVMWWYHQHWPPKQTYSFVHTNCIRQFLFTRYIWPAQWIKQNWITNPKNRTVNRNQWPRQLPNDSNVFLDATLQALASAAPDSMLN